MGRSRLAMPRDIDLLTSNTLKHLRDRWWPDAFTTFLEDTLQPLPDKRILDVGCGRGTAELAFLERQNSGGQNHGGQAASAWLVAIDIVQSRVREARAAAQDRGLVLPVATADAVRLPFARASFDASFAVAVLQHVPDPIRVLRECVRVTRPGGRIVIVEPDNGARYFFSSLESGRRAFELGTEFFAALATSAGDPADPVIGPKLPSLFLEVGIEPVTVQLFPVPQVRVGAPAPSVWDARQHAIAAVVSTAPSEALERLGRDYLKAVGRYRDRATAAGPAFVEIQHTILFAAIGQNAGEEEMPVIFSHENEKR
ncbi:MAG: methyltransferase domain-containing protein [Luteitalea sp.]|nr:methyltransferase domain-containing protein [Luteitalea sp.]